MARSGDELTHPGTGERIVWKRVAHDTHGDLVECDLFALPGGHPAAAHVHPHQQERFGVVAGSITLRVDGDVSTLEVGDWAEVPVGTPHTWWNDGSEDAHVLVQFSPALRTEMFFETFFGLAEDGKTNARGLPNPLNMAVILREYREEIRLAQPSAALQTVLFAPLAVLGRALGYRGWYPEYTAQPIARTSRRR